MTKEELKKEAKSYAKRKFDEEEQVYLHDIIAQTYFAGAEPREKRIAELEQENAELKNKLTEKVTLESLDVVSAKMNDLEKENSELKRNKKTVVHLAGCLEEKMKERIEELETRCNELFLQNNEFAEQLTKAKEIIKDLYFIIQYRIEYKDNIPLNDSMSRAEQFIKEIEK